MITKTDSKIVSDNRWLHRHALGRSSAPELSAPSTASALALPLRQQQQQPQQQQHVQKPKQTQLQRSSFCCSNHKHDIGSTLDTGNATSRAHLDRRHSLQVSSRGTGTSALELLSPQSSTQTTATPSPISQTNIRNSIASRIAQQNSELDKQHHATQQHKQQQANGLEHQLSIRSHDERRLELVATSNLRRTSLDADHNQTNSPSSSSSSSSSSASNSSLGLSSSQTTSDSAIAVDDDDDDDDTGEDGNEIDGQFGESDNDDATDNDGDHLKSKANSRHYFDLTWRNLSFSVPEKRIESKLAMLRHKLCFFSTPASAGDDATSSSLQAQPSDSSCRRKFIFSKLSGCARSGQLTAILGPSGAGKTTLLNCLTSSKIRGVSGCIQVQGDTPTCGKLKLCTIPQKGESSQ